MRSHHILALAALSLAASPAAADVTARYVAVRGGLPAMTIEVNDRGDSRTTMGNQAAVVTLDGVSYLIMADLGGTYVARQDDLYAVLAENFRAVAGEHLPAAQPGAPAHPPAGNSAVTALRAVQHGEEIVGGRRGTVWSVAPTDGAMPGGLDFVINTDADLAPVGRVLARQMRSSFDALHGIAGPELDHSTFLSSITSILERGTAIRIGRMMRLDSVETGPVPAADLALPSPPLTREQLAIRMRGGAVD